MGYVARYRQEAQEKNLPHWNRFVIAQLEENLQEAIIAQQGYNTPNDPEFPKVLSSYEEAFAWLECKLTMRAADVCQSHAWNETHTGFRFCPDCGNPLTRR